MNTNKKELTLDEMEAVNGGGFGDFLWKTAKGVADTTKNLKDEVKNIIKKIF